MEERTKITAPVIREMKKKGRKIVSLTAYDYATSKLLDESGIHLILVGDSLGNAVLGYENTLPVTMEEMLHHTKAVVRGKKYAMVVGDMPFMSYHVSIKDALKNAGRFVKEGGADAVKLEGGMISAEKVKAIVSMGIPVMGHIGLTPQSIHEFGGYKVQGKEPEAAKKLIEDAKSLENAGVFSMVLECVPSLLAKKISETVAVPTIGIGAGKFCDGQILVINDLIGLSWIKPKFVKKYTDVAESMKKAFKSYKEEVENSIFPSEEHSY